MAERIDYYAVNPAAINSMVQVKKQTASIDRKLRALLELRVSQINGCVYCVDLHSHEARLTGESQQRLDCIVAWQESSFFDEREKAALAWAEAVTRVEQTGAPDMLYENLSSHFSEAEIVDLTIIVAQMNALNRVAISFRHEPDARET